MKKFTISLFSIATLLVSNAFAQSQHIMVSLSGNGSYTATQDGISATVAGMGGQPSDVCSDAAGNIYYVEQGSKIRKITAANGVVTTYAGGGSSVADGVAATTALISPAYMCMDAAGNMYFTTGNQVKEVVAATGTIVTIAGAISPGHSGDGGAATGALLNAPGGICLDGAGNIYVVDGGQLPWVGSAPFINYIRKINIATGIITNVAGTGVAGYSGDGGPATSAQINAAICICADAAGNIYFSDQPSTLSFGGGAYVRKVDAATGHISTIAGTGGYPANGDGGPASAACLGNIYGIDCDDSGDIYICDISCSCRRIDAGTGTISTIAGSITIDGYGGDGIDALDGLLSFPYGVHVNAAGDVLIADHANDRIRRAIKLTTTPSFAYGNGQYVNTCPGIANPLDYLMTITDLDVAQTETWTVLTPPVHGSLAGFPATASSRGVDSVSLPAGTSYTSQISYTGMDSFRVRVSDGALSSTITVYINVNMNTAGGIVSSDPSGICATASTTLTENTLVNGTWGTYNNTIAGVDASGNLTTYAGGLDTIYYSSPSGCDATSFIVGPYAGTISGSNDICNTSEATLSSSVSGGVWSCTNANASISADGVISGAVAGTDTVLYTVSNTCGTATTTQYMTISNCTTGISNTSAKEDISIYPNPAYTVLNLEWTNWQSGNTPVVITNTIGTEVYRATLANNSQGTGNMQLNISTLPAGIYFIKASDKFVQKFVKE